MSLPPSHPISISVQRMSTPIAEPSFIDNGEYGSSASSGRRRRMRMDSKLVDYIDGQLDFICDSEHVLTMDIHSFAERLFNSFSFLKPRNFIADYPSHLNVQRESLDLLREDEFVSLFVSMLKLRQVKKAGHGSPKAREEKEINELRKYKEYFDHLYPKGYWECVSLLCDLISLGSSALTDQHQCECENHNSATKDKCNGRNCNNHRRCIKCKSHNL